MSWTTTTPNQPGWYWVQNDKVGPSVVQVVQQGFGVNTLVPAFVVQNWNVDGTEQWQGPIQPD